MGRVRHARRVLPGGHQRLMRTSTSFRAGSAWSTGVGAGPDRAVLGGRRSGRSLPPDDQPLAGRASPHDGGPQARQPEQAVPGRPSGSAVVGDSPRSASDRPHLRPPRRCRRSPRPRALGQLPGSHRICRLEHALPPRRSGRRGPQAFFAVHCSCPCPPAHRAGGQGQIVKVLTTTFFALWLQQDAASCS